LSHLFMMLPLGRLQTLVVDGRSLRREERIDAFEPSICERIALHWHSSLRSLQIANLIATPLAIACRDLLALRSPIVFSLRNCPSFSFNGVNITEIAAAWPNITSLASPDIAGLSLSTLPVFAQKCPHPIEITLYTDHRMFHPSPRHPLPVTHSACSIYAPRPVMQTLSNHSLAIWIASFPAYSPFAGMLRMRGGGHRWPDLS
jgi:hypothetical protein